MDFWLKDCKIVPENIEVSISIEDGKIISLKKIAPRRGAEIINMKGSVILPGLIDAHVHLRDPGLTYKEDFQSGTRAAAIGGFTTIIDMPNTIPPTNTPRAFIEKLKIASKKSIIDFGLHAGVSNPADINKVNKLKPASFKIYMDLIDKKFLNEIFRVISKINSNKPLISLHCEDKDIVTNNINNELKKKKFKPENYANTRPPLAETTAVSNALSLAHAYGLTIHICHVSVKESVELINKAKKSNISVTSEITPHHLLLNLSYLKKCGNFAKTNPPLRDNENKIDVSSLSNIDIIGTDHAPHTISEKEQNIWDAPPGIPNLESTLPLLLNETNRQNITFTDLKKLLCENPAKIFHLKNKGFIKEGMDADIVMVDMKKEGFIKPDDFKSKAKYSPFKGFKIKGMPIMTMVRGEVVMEEGELFKSKGKFVNS
ncbi:MAG: dihydroorotase [Methanobacterium sp.]